MKHPLKLKLFIITLIIIAAAAFIIFNENGLFTYMQLKQERNLLKVTADSMDIENKRLEEEIDSLSRKVPAKIEQAAREKYDMLREGETKVEVIER
jgi:cell division protein FtsB